MGSKKASNIFKIGIALLLAIIGFVSRHFF